MEGGRERSYFITRERDHILLRERDRESQRQRDRDRETHRETDRDRVKGKKQLHSVEVLLVEFMYLVLSYSHAR